MIHFGMQVQTCPIVQAWSVTLPRQGVDPRTWIVDPLETRAIETSLSSSVSSRHCLIETFDEQENRT